MAQTLLYKPYIYNLKRSSLDDEKREEEEEDFRVPIENGKTKIYARHIRTRLFRFLEVSDSKTASRLYERFM